VRRPAPLQTLLRALLRQSRTGCRANPTRRLNSVNLITLLIQCEPCRCALDGRVAMIYLRRRDYPIRSRGGLPVHGDRLTIIPSVYRTPIS